MIDTIRFAIPSSNKLIRELSQYGLLYSKTDASRGILLQYRLHTQIKTPSYDRAINFFYNSNTDQLHVEFSIAKYYYNHNVYLMYSNDIEKGINKFFDFLRSRLPSIPPLNTWLLDRLDVCYSWKLQDQASVENLCKVIQSLKYPRQKVYRYQDSIMFVGSSYSSKFYLKYPEFYKHDYPYIVQYDPDQAHKLLSIASGVLRYEVTIRKNWLKTHGLRINASQLHTLNTYQLLNHFLQKTLPPNTTTTNKIDVYDRLANTYRANKALRLYQFWSLYFSTSYDRFVLDRSLSRSQIWRNKKDLSNASIGIPSDVPVSLSIPSPYSVN